MNGKIFTVRLSADENAVEILDQTLLPNRVEYLRLETAEQLYEAVFKLRVRGAPAIGVCAGFGMYVLARKISDDILPKLRRAGEYLVSSRPTAVNLSWAVKRMLACAERGYSSRDELLSALRSECTAICDEDIATCRAISENGLGTLLLGRERGYEFHVYSDETRPLLQGARLTSFELNHAGIDVTLICDNAASLLMKQGKIQACFVGCDRVAANGDVANKIGTRSVAINAKFHGIPFYVFCPGSTIDFGCATGDDIVIEERSGEEIKSMFFSEPVAEPEVKCWNPAFDVTDAELVTAIITERGIARYPYTESLKRLYASEGI